MNRNQCLAPVLIPLILLATVAQAAPPGTVSVVPQNVTAKEIRAAYHQRNLAYARKDTDTILAFYDERYRLVTENPKVSEGKDRLKPFLNEIFRRSAAAGLTTTVETLRVQGNTATARVRENFSLTRYNLLAGATGPLPQSLVGLSLKGDIRFREAVWQRDKAGKWRLLRETILPVATNPSDETQTGQGK